MNRFPHFVTAAAALTVGPFVFAQTPSPANHPAGNGSSNGHAASPATPTAAVTNANSHAPANGALSGTNPVAGNAAASAAAAGSVAVANGNVAVTAATPANGNGNAGGNGNGNGGGNGNGNGPAQTNAHAPNPKASSFSNAVQSVLQKFDASRDQIVQQRQTLVDKLAAAKDATERQAIEQELKNDEQTMQAQARATAKEIRAELQALRRQRTGGGG